MKFSIIVVALNAGEKLNETVQSILNQTYTDYEIVVKDGGSKDGSVEALPEDERIKLFVEKDTGIYDAMNQAVSKAQGEYILFLNCGDSFYDNQVLERAASCIDANSGGKGSTDKAQGEPPLVVYGDTYGAKNNVMIAAPKKIDGFACYRNIPCHQSCFYDAQLCKEKPYLPEYRIRADYEHFLWCYYKAKAKMVYMGSTVASYEGGGYSESKENRKRDKEEHKLITEAYMEPGELAGYRRAMNLSFAPLRSFLAENKLTSWLYHWLKDCLYHHKLRMLLGLVFLVVELYLFLGTGVMGEEVVSYHTGEGSWEVGASAEAPGFCQEFIPQYDKLESISVLMYKEHMQNQDGVVNVIIADEANEIVFEEQRELAKVKNGQFTDVKVNLEVASGKKYYLTVLCEPSSTGEYPMLGVCGLENALPESGLLVHEDELQGTQLVSRYCYDGVVPASKMRNVIIICVVTALGIMFGLPDNKYLRWLAALVLLLAGPYVLGSRLELLTFNEFVYLPISMKWNLGIMYGLELFLLLCTHSPRITVAVSNILLTAVYSVNFFMVNYRGTPLRMNDLSAIGTAAQVVGDYEFVPNDHLAFAWGLLALLVVFGVQTGTGRCGKKADKPGYVIKKAVSYAVTIAIAVAAGTYGGYQLLYTDLLNRVGFADEEYRGLGYDAIYYANGYLVGTCVDLKNLNVKPMEGYSVEVVEEILTEAATNSGEAGEENPHVILIMNESFSDLRVLGELGLNQENMAFFNSLEENTVRGYVNASVVGGGTANSEFEVLTGCNMAFFSPNYYPYEQAVKKPMDSFVSQMEDQGYTTYAMHPEPGRNWNRSTVYKYLGFDQMFFKEDFAGAEEIHSGVSDAETYKKIIDLYESRQEGEKLFVFDVTMQNHGGYSQEDGPDEVVSTTVNEPELNEFLSLMKISDEAFADLVAYFETQDEKVVICMFGDHQPWVSNLIVENDSSLPLEELQKKYKTPFVIWANYDIEEADGYDISMNYLGGLLQRTAGIPLSPYFSYQEKLREDYPIITLNCYGDKEGNFYNWGSEGNEFPEYRMLQYNYLFDDTVEWGY